MQRDIAKILITEEEIRVRLRELGQQLTEDYKDKNPIFVGILQGVVVFFGNMIQQIPVYCQTDFMCVSSYSGTESSGQLLIKKDLSADIRGRHVVILEDIVDTGHTLCKVLELLRSREPASIKICALLDKPERRENPVTIDYVGFTIPNEFVVGYGLDYNEQYRNLPFVGVLKPEIYAQ